MFPDLDIELAELQLLKSMPSPMTRIPVFDFSGNITSIALFSTWILWIWNANDQFEWKL